MLGATHLSAVGITIDIIPDVQNRGENGLQMGLRSCHFRTCTLQDIQLRLSIACIGTPSERNFMTFQAHIEAWHTVEMEHETAGIVQHECVLVLLHSYDLYTT